MKKNNDLKEYLPGNVSSIINLHFCNRRRSFMILKLVVCILLRVLDQVQGFHLTQHWFEDGHKTEACSGY
jgi:hypothetical protein